MVGELVYDPWYEYLPRSTVDWIHSIRLWTHGWDFYTPTSNPILKQLHTIYSPDQLEIEPQRQEAAYQRLWTFLEFVPDPVVDLAGYGTGKNRSILQFVNFTGVDWKERRVKPHAKVGMALIDYRANRRMDFHYPFENEEVVAKYGSWTDFYEETDYRSTNVETVPKQ
jgi:hypothetical protein